MSERTVAREGEKTDMIRSNLQSLNVDLFDRVVMDVELIVMCRAAPKPLRMWSGQRWELGLISKWLDRYKSHGLTVHGGWNGAQRTWE